MTATDFADWTPASQLVRAHAPLFSIPVTHLVAPVAQQFPASPLPFSGIGYSVWCKINTFTSTLTAVLQLAIAWIDSASGQTVDQQIYYIWAGSDSGPNAHIFRITGPAEGNQVQATLTAINNDVQLQALQFFQSSTVYRRHQAASILFRGQGTATVAPNDASSGIVGTQFVAGLGIGATDTEDLALFTGRVFVAASTSSGTSDLQVRINAAAENLGGIVPTPLLVSSDASGRVAEFCQLPRAHCNMAVTNNNAAAKNITWTVASAPEP